MYIRSRENGKRPLQNANVQIYNVQNNDAVSVSTDATGHFNATVNDFVNGSKLYIQAYNSKGKPVHLPTNLTKKTIRQ